MMGQWVGLKEWADRGCGWISGWVSGWDCKCGLTEDVGGSVRGAARVG